jgi:hypothetical protein
MPPDFQQLLARSLELYERIAHLDAQISDRAQQPPIAGSWPPERGSGRG